MPRHVASGSSASRGDTTTVLVSRPPVGSADHTYEQHDMCLGPSLMWGHAL